MKNQWYFMHHLLYLSPISFLGALSFGTVRRSRARGNLLEVSTRNAGVRGGKSSFSFLSDGTGNRFSTSQKDGEMKSDKVAGEAWNWYVRPSTGVLDVLGTSLFCLPCTTCHTAIPVEVCTPVWSAYASTSSFFIFIFVCPLPNLMCIQ